jgi:hypothetical protein
MSKPTASLSLDLDNLWVYLKTRGHSWEDVRSYLPSIVPLILDALQQRGLRITFFIIGRDAAREENHGALAQIVQAGHEIGNHSFNHEPWIEDYDGERVTQELKSAERSIQSATGQRPIGFRGPGYCYSAATIQVVKELGYRFDASLLPSILGPVARLYYFWGSGLGKAERQSRQNLYGRARDGLLPLEPFHWTTARGELLEIPVTTIPLLRVPFHPSYVLWLSGKSRRAASGFMKFGLQMCRLWRVEPSIILHPLDFLGADDAPEVSFFPGMDLSKERKLDMLGAYLDELQMHFDPVPLSEHARRIEARGTSVRRLPTTRIA